MPPMPAPLPAPLPPLAIAPPAAPTPAPRAPPTAASLTTSPVLSLLFAWASRACALHDSTAADGGGLAATRAGAAARGVAGGAAAGVGGADAVWAGTSGLYQLATTSPVISAVAITSASPMVVIFHGFHLSCGMARPPGLACSERNVVLGKSQAW